MLITSINKNLNDLIALLDQITGCDYSKQCPALSNASIGEHTRHIIEMFQCLQNNYEQGLINYDSRGRNIVMQTDPVFAMECIIAIQENLKKDNKELQLQQIIDKDEIRIETNYFRELLYNLEHCIHHQALIKVAILDCKDITINPDFGVARSTIEYRNQCAQ